MLSNAYRVLVISNEGAPGHGATNTLPGRLPKKLSI